MHLITLLIFNMVKVGAYAYRTFTALSCCDVVGTCLQLSLHVYY